MLSILALLYGAAVLTGVQAECQTTAEGYTWSFQADRDEMLLDIQSAEACLSSCFEDHNCNGYTWLTDVVVDICYKFQVLQGQHTCYGCHSGTVPTIFHEEACKEDTSHLISVVTADSSDSCYISCLGTESCTGFTWYNQLTSLPYYCFLYGECVDTIPCLGCSSGILNCIGQSSTTASPSTTTTKATTTTTTSATTYTSTTTTTTATTATTTTITTTATTTTTTTTASIATSTTSSLLPVPPQCQPDRYRNLNDPTRNEDHGYEDYCDRGGHSYTSPDWHGPGYYRIESPAGDKIPTSSPGMEHCGTNAPGWINDEEGAIEQMEVGEEITLQVCFEWNNDLCNWTTEIKVTCCHNFFVYYLPNTPGCKERYCASFV